MSKRYKAEKWAWIKPNNRAEEPTCTCEPQYMRKCPECDGTEKECFACSGYGLIDAQGDLPDESMVVVHDYHCAIEFFDGARSVEIRD